MAVAERRSLWAEISEDKLRIIARIIGLNSAAHRALAEMATRRSQGQIVLCYQHGGQLVVGPPLDGVVR